METLKNLIEPWEMAFIIFLFNLTCVFAACLLWAYKKGVIFDQPKDERVGFGALVDWVGRVANPLSVLVAVCAWIMAGIQAFGRAMKETSMVEDYEGAKRQHVTTKHPGLPEYKPPPPPPMRRKEIPNVPECELWKTSAVVDEIIEERRKGVAGTEWVELNGWGETTEELPDGPGVVHILHMTAEQMDTFLEHEVVLAKCTAKRGNDTEMSVKWVAGFDLTQ